MAGGKVLSSLVTRTPTRLGCADDGNDGRTKALTAASGWLQAPLAQLVRGREPIHSIAHLVPAASMQSPVLVFIQRAAPAKTL